MANNKSILYSILDGMPMAVYLKDMNCKITYFNKFAKNSSVCRQRKTLPKITL